MSWELQGDIRELKEEIESLRAELAKERECVDFYANEMSYTIDSYEGCSGEMRSRVVLYGDSDERNDIYSYAGRRARQRQLERKQT